MAESPPATPPAPTATVPPGHDNFNAVLWTQTSAEYQALARQAYTTGQLALDEALDDPTWTASVEQERQGNFANLPAAVVLDIDETVLDNSAYQARLIRDRANYSSESWAAWTAEEAATAISGAQKYAREADARGIAVVYITNRKLAEESATRNNLRALGFPVAQHENGILSRGERPEWSSSDKTLRREAVATRYRILQLVGDNLGDFIEVSGDAAQRREAAARYADYWGMRWIVLPNPNYGSWESALFGGDYKKTAAQQRAAKEQALRY